MRFCKKTLCVLLAMQMLLLLVSCGKSEIAYSADGMTITMDEGFEASEYYGMTYYDSEDVQVYVAKEEFSLFYHRRGEKTIPIVFCVVIVSGTRIFQKEYCD